MFALQCVKSSTQRRCAEFIKSEFRVNKMKAFLCFLVLGQLVYASQPKNPAKVIENVDPVIVEIVEKMIVDNA